MTPTVGILLPCVSDDPLVQANYVCMRLNGQSHNMAEVLATRSFPGTRTDREFQSGRQYGQQFESCPALGDFYRAEAEAQGVSTTGKVYLPSLADFPGDPTAWVSDRGDVLRVAREKALKVSGLVDYEPPDFRQQEPPDLARPAVDPGLVAAEVDELMALDPGQRRADVEERVTQLRSGQIDEHGPRVRDGNPDDHLVEW